MRNIFFWKFSHTRTYIYVHTSYKPINWKFFATFHERDIQIFTDTDLYTNSLFSGKLESSTQTYILAEIRAGYWKVDLLEKMIDKAA